MASVGRHHPAWSGSSFSSVRARPLSWREPSPRCCSTRCPCRARASRLFRYTILELNTAVKRGCSDTLFERGYDRVGTSILASQHRYFVPLARELDAAPPENFLTLTPIYGFHRGTGIRASAPSCRPAPTTSFLAVSRRRPWPAFSGWWRRSSSSSVLNGRRARSVRRPEMMDLAPETLPEWRSSGQGYNVAYVTSGQRSVVA